MIFVWILSYLATFFIGAISVFVFGAIIYKTEEKRTKKEHAMMPPPDPRQRYNLHPDRDSHIYTSK